MTQALLQILILIAGFALLVKGADWFVDGAAGIARRFGIPPLIIGLTIVAMGTSAPEAAVSITAAARGSAEITIGNIVGSNVLNVFIILGITALIAPLAVEKTALKVDMPLTVLTSLLLLFLGWDGRISRGDGVLLWVVFLLFLGHLLWEARKTRTGHKATEEEYGNASGNRPLWTNLLLTAVGLAMIILGSRFAVSGASSLTAIAGLSERFIGLTIVALGTSLPELVTSVMAARKGSADIAIGNIVGSNLFNILFVVGTSALLIPVPFAAGFRLDTLVAAGAALLLWVFCLPKRKLPRAAGAVFLVCYAVYFAVLTLG